MDFLVVAAAAGAGYLAKYWQNLPGENDSFSVSSSGDFIQGQSESRNFLRQIGDQTSPLGSELDGDVSSEKEDFSDGRFQEMELYGGHSATGVASTRGSDGKVLTNVGNYVDDNVLSLTSFLPDFSGWENFQENVEGINRKNDFFDNSGFVLHEFGIEENSSFTRFSRNHSLRSRRSRLYSVKPLNSLGSCITAQLNTERAKMEENVYSVPSPSTTRVRPLLVTDGIQIISGVSSDSQIDGGKDKLKNQNGVCLEENNTLLGISSFQPIGSVELPRKPKQRFGMGRFSSFGSRVSSGPFHSQDSPNGMLLFFIGITVGIMSIIVTNKREVDKLSEVLKQTENLVKDLQEELEMKDMLTVKEVASQGYQSQGTNNCFSYNEELIASSYKPDLYESIKYDGKRSNDQKVDNPELISKIEAELEAELERLELNMKASSLERIYDFIELDPSFQADVVQGDLKLDAARGQPGGPSDLDSDTSGTSPNGVHTANYAVSPLELSLRLHEVIESRLEARIKELETAFQNSQKRVHFLESKHVISDSGLAYSEVGSSSTPASSTFIGEDDDLDQTLVINLSLEALDAYNDGYRDIIRTEIDGES